MFARINWRHFDWPLLVVVLALCGVSVAMIFSATHNSPTLAEYWLLQVQFVGIGLVALFLVAMFDYRQLSLLAVPAFIVFIVSLVVVFFFGDTQGSGSQSWISVGGRLVQPTEAGKFLIIIFLSWYLSWFRDSMHKLPYLLMALFLLFTPLILVYIQPDFGMTITYAFLGGALIMVSGVRYRHLAILGAMALLVVPLLAPRCKATCWRASASSCPPTTPPVRSARRSWVSCVQFSTACPASASSRRPTPPPPTMSSRR
jgi:cell division protein FtsW (lipid II flippase)